MATKTNTENLSDLRKKVIAYKRLLGFSFEKLIETADSDAEINFLQAMAQASSKASIPSAIQS